MIAAISGSRYWSNPAHVQQVVRALVAEQISQGNIIAVGDNPNGVDLWVVEALRETDNIDKGICFWSPHAHIEPRNGGLAYNICNKFEGVEMRDFVSYADRDEGLVDIANGVIALWNGRSKGTRRVYEYALAQGKDAGLRRLEGVSADGLVQQDMFEGVGQ